MTQCYEKSWRGTHLSGMSLSPRPFWLALVLCAMLVGSSLFSAAQASATAGESPTIDGTSVTDFTEHSATLVAQINPRGGETTYEFRLVWKDADPPAGGEPVTGGAQTQGGHIAAAFGDQTVSATVTGLQPGYTYWYVVVATNSAGRTKGGYFFGFWNSGAYPKGVGTGPPYESETPLWYIRLSEAESAQTVREYEAKLRQAAIEQEERRAREAAIRDTEAAALKRREEEEVAAEAVVRLPACNVPSLKGDTLSAARRAIEKAHCRLGRVNRPRHHRGALVVIGQAPRRGKKLAGGTTIAVTLGPAQSRRRPVA